MKKIARASIASPRDRALFEKAAILRSLYNMRSDKDRRIEWPGTDTAEFTVEKAQKYITSEFVLKIADPSLSSF